MEIKIYTKRPFEYGSFLNLLKEYDYSVEFLSSYDKKLNFSDLMKADILIADTALLESDNHILDYYRRNEKSNYIVSAPDYAQSIVNEVKKHCSHLLKKKKSQSNHMMNGRNLDLNRLRNDIPEKTCQITHSEVYSDECQSVNELKVGIVGMSSGAGASYITMLLAEELASLFGEEGKTVTVASLDGYYYYDALGMEARFADKKFVDITENYLEIRQGEEIINEDEGVNWAVLSPEYVCREISFDEKAKIVSKVAGSVVLWDMDLNDFKHNSELAAETLDLVMLVIDPLPSKMLAGCEILDITQNMSLPVINIINKMNEGVDLKEVEELLAIENPVIMPLADLRCIYASEYAGENPYRNNELREEAIRAVTRLSDIIESIIAEIPVRNQDSEQEIVVTDSQKAS